MPFVQGSSVEKARKNSLEAEIDEIHEAVASHYGEGVDIVATFSDSVLAFNREQKLRSISWAREDNGDIEIQGDKASRAIPVIEDEDVPSHVSESLRKMAKRLMEGKALKRTQVRELSAFVKSDEMYWMSDIVRGIDESIDGSDWYKMYDANVERIRTSLHGQIREIEGSVPRTHYSKIGSSRLGEFKKEVGESMDLLANVFKNVQEDCKDLSFGGTREFLGAVNESLIVEAQAMVGLLGKAAKLRGHDDMPLVAKAHDKLAERARTMALVAAYLNAKSKPFNKE